VRSFRVHLVLQFADLSLYSPCVGWGAGVRRCRLLAVAGTLIAAHSTPISEIALERRCFGCTDAFEVTFRADGSASRVLFGDARRGIPDRRSKGSIEPRDFERLAALLLAEDFFDLRDSYEDPKLQDGTSLTVSARRGGEHKRVLDRNQAGPAGLKKIETSVAEAAGKIDWIPASER
jgi:hypothetical protein